MLWLPAGTAGPARGNRKAPPPRKGGAISGAAIGSVGLAAVAKAGKASAIGHVPAARVSGSDEMVPVRIAFEELAGVVMADEPPEPFTLDTEDEQ